MPSFFWNLKLKLKLVQNQIEICGWNYAARAWALIFIADGPKRVNNFNSS